ncbi:ribonuclease BN (tRNA processing enzyme) [Cytobacillus oceanisediminis]|jgi:ribonuclease BN (tRNA processing enzyme)|uniref:Ribonuclease BN (tRNA processing enzyme) n=1 Tax=Cytobacillus oceanisediminis TaxID=665099 RepID=A0A2V2ZTS9_9BACI|nr:MBL fold metallo-hydrolase [Cytobacillus oceanisediminis]PWW27779.1 ribonuclease BN (tRNA processing enzyme) [Cytobacillus oceanisediminis]
MKLTVIGGWGGYPKAEGASSGYLLEHEGFHLLIDCGSGVLAKMQNFFQPEDLDSVIISHYHPDHIADIGVLQHARLIQGFLGKKSGTLPIYGHTLDQQEFAKLTYKDITKGVAYNPEEVLSAGPFLIRFLKTNHPVPCYAMRIEAGGKTLIYTADTSYKEELETFSDNADLLVCECNFYGHQNGKNAGHMTSLDAGILASKANVKNLLLTHLPHYGELQKLKEEAASKYNGPISIADYQWSHTF